MTKPFSLLLSAAAISVVSVSSVLAATQTVTEKKSVVAPDGSVVYQSHSVVTDAGAAPVVISPVTFYYYDVPTRHVLASQELTDDVIAIWDTDKNKYIDNHEFYNNAYVVYEPVEYTKRTYQDFDMDGTLELTQEEYTTRVQQLPYYANVNTDKKEGLSVYEFTGVGFREADVDSDNQVSYDELKKAFYGQAWNAKNPDLYNK